MLELFANGLEWFGFTDRRVQVGISEHGQRDSHGSVSTGREKIAFTVDRPALLKRPTETTLEGIFEQFLKLGVKPSAIELTVGKFKRVYQRKNGALILTYESQR